MEWLEHVWGAENDILKKVLTETIHKKRSLGRPRTRWKGAVEKYIWTVDNNVLVGI